MRPERIGPYRVLDAVAEDTFTVTYRAEDPGLGRTVLLKTQRGLAAGPAVRERLLREAKMLAPLSHPGLLRLHGVIQKEDAVYLLYEDASGARLSELLARTPRLIPARAVAVARGVASALAHLHAHGIVHGGLRPERVALSKEGGVTLADYSTAHAAGKLDDGGEPIPPEYLAPEQILSEGTGPRADVFSLGVLLFEMLSGQRPWTEPPPPKRSPDVLAPAPPPEARHVLAHKIRSAAPPPLVTSDGPPPATLARIVSRCLAKDPADRYPDAAAVTEDLEDALREASNEPASALVVRALAAGDFAPDLPPRAARAPVELSPARYVPRRLLTELAVVFGLIVLGGAVTEWSREGTRPAPPPSETPPGARGYLRVLAQPWAEVVVDGETIDTTPMARPIAVAPGRHFVTFLHPNAPEEKRTVDISAGQTVLLDVAMRIDRPARDAGSDALPEDDSP
ncbi:MAG: serine/threonine-protein kinase [Polyangiaceae bacterium]